MITLVLALSSATLAAQPAGHEGTTHTDPITRADVAEETKEAVLSIVEDAMEAGLPVEPLLAKFLEGVSKGVPEARVVAAVRSVHARIVRAAELLLAAVESGAAQEVTGADVARVAAGLSAGVPPDQVILLGRAAAVSEVPISRVSVAVGTLERLRAMGVYEDSAAEALAAALSAGRPESDLRRFAEDYRRHAEAGGDGASFFDALPRAWGRGGLSGTGLGQDAAGRLDDGRLPDEAAGGESMVPGTEGLRSSRDEDEDPYDKDRSGPYDDLIPDIPDDPDDPEDPDDPDDPEDPDDPDDPRPDPPRP